MSKSKSNKSNEDSIDNGDVGSTKDFPIEDDEDNLMDLCDDLDNAQELGSTSDIHIIDNALEQNAMRNSILVSVKNGDDGSVMMEDEMLLP